MWTRPPTANGPARGVPAGDGVVGRIPRRRPALLLTLLLVIAGCAIAEDLAKNAPQAKPPEVYQTAKLHKWPDDVSYYSDGFTFELFVKHGFTNELTLTENGVRLTPFDGADPDNDKKTVYQATDLDHDTTAKTTRSHYVIFPKRSADGTPGQPHGQVNEYKLVERSINPSYKGTPEESKETGVTVTVVTKPAAIALFDVPGSVEVGKAATISWRVNDCKKVELLENDSVIAEKTVSGFAGTVEDSKSIVVKAKTKFSLRAYNARRKVVQQESELLVTNPPPCPDNPGGQPQYFTFCVKCPGGSLGEYSSEWVQQSCKESTAQEQVQRYNSNCTVTPGPCPKPEPTPSPKK